MGNTCEIDESCYKTETRQQMRKEKPSVVVEKKISQKDLVQIKKTPISKDYTVMSPAIGKGTFGSVYKAINKQSGIIFAVKKIPINRELQKQIHEILTLKQLDHPSIIRIIDVYEEQLFIYVVMEMCNGGQLFDRVVDRKNISQSNVRFYMQQLLSAVAYCHMNRIMHRDLKPENIMLVSAKQDNLKIIDFGASTKFIKGQPNSLKVGSVYYIAPEVISKKYTEKCDIWSLGVIFYMMLTGSPPFNGKTDKIIFEKIAKGSYEMPEKKFSVISEQAKDLLKKMLILDPEKRITARQALSHPWILSSKIQDKNLFVLNQFSSIKQFCAMNKFKQQIMTYITHNLTTAEELQKMRAQFQGLDNNKDGRISWKEFQKCILQSGVLKIKKQELRQIFDRLDQNSSGFIDYSQFITSSLSRQLLQSKEIISKAFDMIDKDKDGYLNKDEVTLAMGGMEENLYEQMLIQCDINKDGKISKQQFVIGMTNISQNKIKNNIMPSSTTRVQTYAS